MTSLGVPLEIELESGVDQNGTDWGPIDRDADHAQVVLDAGLNALVAFHSTRIDPVSLISMKQVEVAYFKFDSVNQTWTQAARALVGDVIRNPLGSPYQAVVNCERPDVVLVDDYFFVTWTRIYEPSLHASQENAPAVLEGVWVHWNSASSSLVVNNGGVLPAGQGFIIDDSYWVRECAGVPDAVSLGALYGTGTRAVGIVYAHQWDFSDPSVGDVVRKFNLRFKSCVLNTSSGAISKTDFPDIKSGVRFHGPTDGSPGLILPELASAGNDAHFFLAYEEQVVDPNGGVGGQIVLQLHEIVDPSLADYQLRDSHLFGGVIGTKTRRPTLSTFRSGSSNAHIVSIAFNTIITGGDGDVFYEEWDFSNGATKVNWPSTHGWDNNSTTTKDRKPIPLHGRDDPSNPLLNFRRCYAERDLSGSSCGLLKYDFATDSISTITCPEGLQRPSASYIYDSTAQVHWAALTWEQIVLGESYTRIFISFGH